MFAHHCCEPLHHKVDISRKHIPNLRRISMSPWVDVEAGAAAVGSDLIFSYRPNPAIMNNRCYTVLIENCTLQHATQFDPGEDIATHLIPMEEIPRLVTEGRINHALVVVALYHFHLARNG